MCVEKLFFRFAGFVLLLTAIAKLISSTGQSRILDEVDPVLQIGYRTMMVGAGLVEIGLVIALICVRSTFIRCVLLAWISMNFLAYRILLWIGDYGRPCPCLGDLADRIGMNPRTVETLLTITSLVLMIGSVGMLAKPRLRRAIGT